MAVVQTHSLYTQHKIPRGAEEGGHQVLGLTSRTIPSCRRNTNPAQPKTLRVELGRRAPAVPGYHHSFRCIHTYIHILYQIWSLRGLHDNKTEFGVAVWWHVPVLRILQFHHLLLARIRIPTSPTCRSWSKHTGTCFLQYIPYFWVSPEQEQWRWL